MIEFLLSLPGWVLSAIVGLVLGFAALGVLHLLRLRSPYLRYLPLALTAVGYVAADRFIVPEFMRSDLAHCAIARASAEQTNAIRAGTRPDTATTFVAVTADCEQRVLATRYDVDAPRTALDPSGLATVELAFTADTCGLTQLRRMIGAGWRVEAAYHFASGAPLVMTAAC